MLGRYEEALEHYTRAKATVETEGESEEKKERLAGLCRRIAEVYDLRSEYDLSFEWLSRGLGHLQAAEPTLEAAHLYRLGAWIYCHQGKYHEAIPWFQESLALASQINSEEGQRAVAEAYNYLGTVYIRWGELEPAEQYCYQGLQIYEQLRDIAGQARVYHNLGAVYFLQGKRAQAAESWHKSLVIKQEIGDIFEQGYLTNNLGVLHMDQGDWDQAVELLEQSLGLTRQLGALVQEGLALSNLAQVQLYQEKWAEAQAGLSLAQARFAQAGSEEHLPELERRWGEFYLKTGNHDQALSHLQRSLELAVAQQVGLEEGMSYRVLGQLYLAQGELKAAEAALRQSLSILNESSDYEAAKTRLALAHLALKCGPSNEAQDYLHEAIPTFQKLGAKADLAEAQELERRLIPL
jgi:tetratricopeptide (TPR) repeat protein